MRVYKSPQLIHFGWKSKMPIRFTYGDQQKFRRRVEDINIQGKVRAVSFPVAHASYALNNGPEREFYVENVPEPPCIDWTYEYKDSPAELRLRRQGQFNLEIPTTSKHLEPGANTIRVVIEDAKGSTESDCVDFSWDPDPLPVSVDRRDLTDFTHIQEVGQVVNGQFDLDVEQNLIRSRAPVHPDSLLVIGSSHGSQEATYTVRFTDFAKIKWLGPSDFFAGHVEADPPIGIKPGWSSAGMAALNPRNEARGFIAYGDHSGKAKEWVVQTAPPTKHELEVDRYYRVRHQVIFENGTNRVRYRIWPSSEDEPSDWLINEDDSAVPDSYPKHKTGAFSLFQHSGMPIEWSDIRIRPLE